MNPRWLIERWLPGAERNTGTWQRVATAATDDAARGIVRAAPVQHAVRARRGDGDPTGLQGMRQTRTSYTEWIGSGGAW